MQPIKRISSSKALTETCLIKNIVYLYVVDFYIKLYSFGSFFSDNSYKMMSVNNPAKNLLASK